MRSKFLWVGLVFGAACSSAETTEEVDLEDDAVANAEFALGAKGANCGGTYGECGEGLYCALAANAKTSCGSDGKPGRCKAVRTPCPTKAAPVCGCDGETYNNKCEAQAAGISVAKKGACPGPTVCPSELRFELDPTNADIDIGTSGHAHNLPWISGAAVTVDVVSCEGAAPPCGECKLGGAVANRGVINGICDDSERKTRCSEHADCGIGGKCILYFGAPVPLPVGGNAVCALAAIEPLTSGSINIETGEGGLDSLNLRVSIGTGTSSGSPCPICVGDSTPMDGVRGGTCQGGPNNNGACDSEGWSGAYSSWTSLDCMPSAGANIGFMNLPVGPLGTDGADWELTTASPLCTGNTADRCFCPAQGKQTESNGCTDKNGCSAEGLCDSAQSVDINTFCEGNPSSDFIPCSSDATCASMGGGTCSRMELQACFPDNGALGAHLVAEGHAASLSSGAGTSRVGSNLCIAATGNGTIDNTAGLPGPGRIQASVRVKQQF